MPSLPLRRRGAPPSACGTGVSGLGFRKLGPTPCGPSLGLLQRPPESPASAAPFRSRSSGHRERADMMKGTPQVGREMQTLCDREQQVVWVCVLEEGGGVGGAAHACRSRPGRQQRRTRPPPRGTTPPPSSAPPCRLPAQSPAHAIPPASAPPGSQPAARRTACEPRMPDMGAQQRRGASAGRRSQARAGPRSCTGNSSGRQPRQARKTSALEGAAAAAPPCWQLTRSATGGARMRCYARLRVWHRQGSESRALWHHHDSQCTQKML